MKNKCLIIAFLCLGINHSQFAQVNWVNETGLSLGATFVNNDTINNINGTGLNAVIKVNLVTSNHGFIEPRISHTDPTAVHIRTADNASFTLELLNGTADIRLDNHQNTLNGESITISNPNGKNITITQTSSDGGGRNIFVDGVAIPGALPASVTASSSTVVRGTGTKAGNFFNATMSSVTGFTWLYNTTPGASFTEGFHLFFSNIALPIELTSFNVSLLENNSVRIDWQTASETNNDFFTIERSSNGTKWEEVTKIDGAGNSTDLLRYSAIDNKSRLGVTYYRLKQTDFDGKFEYSQIKSINNLGLENSQIKIYPNPAINQLTIFGSSSELEEITILNILGQDVTLSTSNIEKNETKIALDLSKLNSGVYFIKTKSNINKIYKQ